jgi:hypothetical protein
MAAWMLLVIVLALLVYGLERNHRRQPRNGAGGDSGLIGSTDVVDRDVERLAADLRVLASATRPRPVSRPTPPSTPTSRRAHRLAAEHTD